MRVRGCDSQSTGQDGGGVRGGGVRAAVSATTRIAPAARSAPAADASVAPVVATSSITSTVAKPGAGRRATKRGPRRRASAPSPVWGGPGRRSRRPTHRVVSCRATARASSSAGSNPRPRRRSRLVGAQVTTAGTTPSRSNAVAIATANHGTTARTLRYLTRATSSRATPSYAKAEHQASTPAGGGAAGGGRRCSAQRAHTGAAGVPHPGHRSGNRAPSTPAPYGRGTTFFTVLWIKQSGGGTEQCDGRHARGGGTGANERTAP